MLGVCRKKKKRKKQKTKENIMSREGSVGSDATGVMEETHIEGVSKQFVSLLLNIRIKPFGGDPLELNEWMKAIDKKKLIYGLTDKEIILLAFETAIRAPSDFIQKKMMEGPGLTWAQLREELQAEYAGEPSALEAMRSLAEVRQRENETLVELGERIRGLSLLAYPQEDIRSMPVLQAQLADCYIDALRDEEIKKEVVKAEPEDVTRAVHLARRNKNFLERVRKRHGGQKQEKISQPTRRNPGLGWGRRRQEDWSAEADPKWQDWSIWKGFHDSPHKHIGVTCWTCRKEGHYSTECPSRSDMRRERRERPRGRMRDSSPAKPPPTSRNQGNAEGLPPKK